MPTPKQYAFSLQDVAEMMVREAGVTEGHWGIFVRFGLQGMNVGTSDEDLRPAAIVPVLELGLQQFDSPTNLTVDAAEVAARRK